MYCYMGGWDEAFFTQSWKTQVKNPGDFSFNDALMLPRHPTRRGNQRQRIRAGFPEEACFCFITWTEYCPGAGEVEVNEAGFAHWGSRWRGSWNPYMKLGKAVPEVTEGRASLSHQRHQESRAGQHLAVKANGIRFGNGQNLTRVDAHRESCFIETQFQKKKNFKTKNQKNDPS